jgi:hypothetical protein
MPWELGAAIWMRSSYSLLYSGVMQQQHTENHSVCLHSSVSIQPLLSGICKLCATLTAAVAVILHPDGNPSRAPSHSTLYPSLKRHGFTNFRCKVQPKLNRGHALKCLQFCREYRNFRCSWHTLKFSDECSVQKGAGHNTERCF